MCELFAMSALHPTNVRISLSELAQHGGATAPHRDGWGMVFYEGRDVRRFREAEAASDSALVRLIREHDYCSNTVLVHLRKATQGERSLCNTQPFARELCGRMHVFAHNGKLPGVEAALPLGRYRPLGETDSEHAFCALMNDMADIWRAPDEPPPLAERRAVFESLARRTRELGPANFLYSDGDALFVHAHERTQADGNFAPPGLFSLSRRCPHNQEALLMPPVHLTRKKPSDEEQVVTLFASVALSAEAWRPLEAGEILVVRDGEVVG
ncbi:MAG: class II glutamine amidotransferase [Myxococcales bacterium]|nr:class II glutamine amidotransferase [Myxococcales bacterium]